jgi:SAM-dependent methyltransferase
MADAYRDDLAYVHDVGFGGYARNAAPVLLQALRQRGLTNGRVVELGCGSGILSAEVAAAGYDVEGFDISPAMIALARARVPGGRFHEQSLWSVDIPPCVAVAAVGECVNYLFDRANTDRALAKLFRRVYAALRPGGVFLFDVAEPGRVPGAGPQRGFREGEDWATLVVATEDRARRRLTREITSFRKVGELYRRDHEVHRLRLLDSRELADQLRRIGFRVRRLRGYGSWRFPPGYTALLAGRSVQVLARPGRSLRMNGGNP